MQYNRGRYENEEEAAIVVSENIKNSFSILECWVAFGDHIFRYLKSAHLVLDRHYGSILHAHYSKATDCRRPKFRRLIP